MSKVNKRLCELIDRLEEECRTQVLRAYEAERSLDLAKEDLEGMRRDHEDAIRWAVERAERDRDRLIEERNRALNESETLRAQLRHYTEQAKIEARAWLRETDIEVLKTTVSEWYVKSYSDAGYVPPAVNPLTDKIPMIKYVRDRWGLGLKESKDIVDEWYAEMKTAFDRMIGITESEQRVLDGNR